MIQEHDYDFFILGLPVYYGYYTYHDLASSTIQFTPLNGTYKEPLYRGDVPNVVLEPLVEESSTNLWSILWKIIKYFFYFLLILIFSPCIIIYYCLKGLWWLLGKCFGPEEPPKSVDEED